MAYIPIMIVKKAHTAKDSNILSSKASLMLSLSGGIYGRGLVLLPKNLVLLYKSLSSPIIPVSASVASFFMTPSAYPYYLNFSKLLEGALPPSAPLRFYS